MAYLIPADKGTHFVLGALATLVALLLGWEWAAAAGVTVAVGREVYGCRKRHWRMDRADAKESAADIVFTLAGCSSVLIAAFIGAHR